MSDLSLIMQAEFDKLEGDDKKRLERLFFTCNTMLGGTSIEVDLNDADFNVAFDRAVSVYRNMSSRSVVLQFGLMEIQPEQSVYVLNERIDNIIKISRGRGIFGGATGNGGFESFGAATINTLLRGGIGPHATSVDLVSYDFALQYQETLARLFATEIGFVFRPDTHELMLKQVPRSRETILLHVAVLKSFGELLRDHFAERWLQKYTLAILKGILGEKYSLFATLPGAQGGTVMKGNELKQASVQEMSDLEDDLLVYGDNGDISQAIRG